jgi:hypothetical protein
MFFGDDIVATSGSLSLVQIPSIYSHKLLLAKKLYLKWEDNEFENM